MSGAVAWQPPGLKTIDGAQWPARHVWCVGRNYAEHAREMGADPNQSPLFFAKPATTLIQGDSIAFPAQTTELHHEVELAVVLASGGRHLTPEQAMATVAGYAVAVDLTRRDVQAAAKEAGHPWEMSKAFDQSAPLGLITPATQWSPDANTAISLSVNGEPRQHCHLGQMIWSVPALLSTLSAQVTLWPGDVVLTGTPAGVGPLAVGDVVTAQVAGLAALRFNMVDLPT